MTSDIFAKAYAVLAAPPCAMHVALAADAPLGRFTVGGRFKQRFPPLWRGLAVVQAGFLAGMALVVLDRGGVLDSGLPADLFWPVVVLTAISLLANVASPSRPERRLWTPVILRMTATAVGAALP